MNKMCFVFIALTSSGLVQAVETLDTTVIESTEDAESRVEDPRVSESEGAQITTARDIESRQAATLSEALSENTSIQVDNVNGSQGSQITIRGMTGSSVSVRVEGAPKNMSQIMHKSSNDRDTVWLNMDMYETVTVVPGAASNVYGNGSLGGVVLLETKDPESVISNGKNWGANLRSTIETNGESRHLSGDLARKFSDKFSANATVSYKDTDPYEDADGNKSSYGGTGSEDESYLVKGVYTPTESQRLEVSYMANTQDYVKYDSEAIEDETKVTADDNTASLQYTFAPLDNDWISTKLRLSREEIEREQLAYGETSWNYTGGVTTDYAELENVSLFQLGFTQNVLRVGADYTKDNIDMSYQMDDGTPLKSYRELTGIFASDTIHFSDHLEVGASIRYDEYTAGRWDSDFEGESAFSQKLSVLWHPFENTIAHGLGISALVGSGYRAPSIYEIYGKGGTNGVFTGTDEDGDGIYEATNTNGCIEGHGSMCTIANEKLKGETSIDTEIGLVYARSGLFSDTDTFSGKATYIHNDIEDMITALTLGSLDTSVGSYGGDAYGVQTYTNVDDAYVQGWEFSLNYENDRMFARASLQKMSGYSLEDDGAKIQLTDIIPKSISANTGMYFHEHQGRMGVEMTARSGRRVLGGRDYTTAYDYPSYELFNLYASYQFHSGLVVQARVDNVSDKLYTTSYFTYDEDSGEDLTSYYAGRNYKVSLSYRF